jgi:hypothetical protein
LALSVGCINDGLLSRLGVYGLLYKFYQNEFDGVLLEIFQENDVKGNY